MFSNIKNTINSLGPGLLYAGAAVGVSHLVMSTQAGAKYGFLLLLLIPLIHVVKYPFYRFGPEYTAVTGKNILHGYKDLGNKAIYIYIIMTIISMCLIQAAVTIVTSSIAVEFFKIPVPKELMPHGPAIAFLLIAASILAIGKYSILDKLMKVIIILLTITTIIAVCSVLFRAPGGFHEGPAATFDITTYAGAIFLAKFLGWMPAPMDISVWHSVWSEEANKESGETAPLKKAMFDFNIGFYGTACLAMCFLALGALVMFNGPVQPSPKGAVFASQLIKMYTDALGSWAYPLIGIAALTTMFSTTLTCLDAYPRTLKESFAILAEDKGKVPTEESGRKSYLFVLALAVVGTIIAFLIAKNVDGAMGVIVAIATVASFVSAPILAVLNYKAMNTAAVPEANRPKGIMLKWCLLGIIVLTVSSIWYLYVEFVKGPPPKVDAKPAAIEKIIESPAKN
ncbi:MAG: divalent metal cation transporter [Lentisphaeraceae bacterium]|nr:divalent metal cation transporter [Lentisphaeraceae bacterium]